MPDRDNHPEFGVTDRQKKLMYDMLMCIPRNLVYVFVAVILFAFLAMLYVVSRGEDMQFVTDGAVSIT